MFNSVFTNKLVTIAGAAGACLLLSAMTLPLLPTQPLTLVLVTFVFPLILVALAFLIKLPLLFDRKNVWGWLSGLLVVGMLALIFIGQLQQFTDVIFFFIQFDPLMRLYTLLGVSLIACAFAYAVTSGWNAVWFWLLLTGTASWLFSNSVYIGYSSFLIFHGLHAVGWFGVFVSAEMTHNTTAHTTAVAKA